MIQMIQILKEIEARMNADDSEITVDQEDYDHDVNMLEDDGQILDQGEDNFIHHECS